jgi:Ca2+:H+ antiporter
VARKILWASLALAPITFLVDVLAHPGDVVLFVLAATALIPLAWLIGEATEHAAEHTGPGIGGFLNASFGNAPEVIISLFAIADGLPEVVRGSLTGSVVSNVLLVFGVALMVQPGEGRLDRRSLLLQLGVVVAAVLLFLIPSIPGFHGDPDRHSLAIVTIPVCIALLGLYLGVTIDNLRRHHRAHAEGEAVASGGWTLGASLVVLGAATGATAVISEILVHSLEAFSESAGLSEFFIAAVIVALVGNAAEHGGAVVIARRGKIRLASEIAVSSSAQVAMFVTPAVALLSWAITPALPLTFRPVELATMAGAAVVVGALVLDGRARRWEGVLLVGAFVGVALLYLAVGDR